MIDVSVLKKGDQYYNQEQDMVNSPSHYQLVNGLEVKDIRKAIFDKIPMGKLSYHQADCYSRAWEYLTRACFKHESPLEDLQKAQTYLNWIIEDLSTQSTVDKSGIRGRLSTTKQTGELK